MSYRFLLLVLLVCSSQAIVRSQDLSSSLWIFGNQVRIDFRTNPPLTGQQAGYNSIEGAATVCDSVTGALLFYTDGQRIFNPDGTLAANDPAIDNNSTTQGALIVRVPNSGNRFIVLAGEDESSPQARMFYRDVTVNAGGSLTVGPTIVLDRFVTEKLTAVRHCNGRDYWVIYKLKDGGIRAVPVVTTGVNAGGMVTSAGLLPVINPNQIRGEMKVSPDGRWLAAVNESLGSELYRFNNATGSATAGVIFDLGTMQYGVCFSSDSRILYTNNGWASLGNVQSSIFQFDLSQANIPASKITIGRLAVGNQPGHMQIAPDGRLYVCINFQNYVGFIPNPNVLGPGCGFVQNGLSLAPGTASFYGLANFPQDVFIPRFTRTDTSVCVGSQIQIGLAPRTGYTYLWSPATGLSDPTIANPVATVTATQTYTVQASDDRGCIVGQNVTISGIPLPTITGLADTSICPGGRATLRATIQAGGTVLWSPATGLSTTTDPTTIAQPTATTTYTLTVNGPLGCTNTQNVTVSVYQVIPPRLSPNGTIDVCKGSSVRIRSGLSTGTFLWNDGSTDSVLVTSTPGGYRVDHIDLNGCTSSDSVLVRELALPTVVASADTSICAGGTATLGATGAQTFLWTGPGIPPTTGAILVITPMGTTTYTVVGTAANGCADTTTITVTVRTPLSTSVGFTDTTICPCDSVVVIVPNTLVSFQWDDGVTSRTRTLRGRQQRTITGMDVNGCAVVPITLRIDTVIAVATYTVTLTNNNARDGERVTLGLRVETLGSLPQCLGNTATATVRMRTSILAPADAPARGVTDVAGMRTVRVPLTKTDTVYAAQLVYIATLGIDDSTGIEVLGVEGSNGCQVAGGVTPAVFTLNEICRAGGIARRFVSPNPAATIVAVMPNPVQGLTTVRIGSHSDTDWQLRIEDVIGKSVGGVLARGRVTGATNLDVPIDVGDLPSGRYMLILDTPMDRTARLIEVIR